MEIFPYIANNRITYKKLLSVLLSMLLCGILVSGFRVQEERVMGCQDSVDAITEASPQENPTQSHSEHGTSFADMAGNASVPEAHAILLRGHNRTESNPRDMAGMARTVSEWMLIGFDLLCKMSVSESKVKQGIFHFRLMPDDEEAPNLSKVA